MDQIYPDIDFSAPHLKKYMSRNQEDGGLLPGKLVFSEQFEAFSGKDLQSSINEISKERSEPVLNVGGPSIVALVHASQLLLGTGTEVRFYGARGDDPAGKFLQSRLEQVPVKLKQFKTVPGATPTTIVLSDPTFNKGHGERAFINNIGTAGNMGPGDLENGFFEKIFIT